MPDAAERRRGGGGPAPARVDRGLVLAVAWRFLRGRGSGLVDGTARSALLATLLGVAAMVVAMALMSGYRRDLEQKLFGGGASLMAYPLAEGNGEADAEVERRLAAIEGVAEVRRVAYGQGSLASAGRPDGLDVSLRGVEAGAPLGRLGELDPGAASAAAPLAGEPPGVLAGAELAERLAAAPGDRLRLMVLGVRHGRPRFRYLGVRLAGTFRSGFSEFDRKLAVVDRELLLRAAGEGAAAGVYEIEMERRGGEGREAAALQEALGSDYLVRDWRELNAELFAALRLQQIALFFVLGLIVLVATFNVASTLVVLVRDRMRDIGVLAALGLAPGGLEGIFLAFGGLLSLAGTAAGAALGCAVAWVFNRYELIRFDPEVAEVYFLSAVSFRVRPVDLAAIVLFTLAVTAVACWLPARRAARILPAVALRYE